MRENSRDEKTLPLLQPILASMNQSIEDIVQRRTQRLKHQEHKRNAHRNFVSSLQHVCGLRHSARVVPGSAPGHRAPDSI
jgi:hypothetical protein